MFRIQSFAAVTSIIAAALAFASLYFSWLLAKAASLAYQGAEIGTPSIVISIVITGTLSAAFALAAWRLPSLIETAVRRGKSLPSSDETVLTHVAAE